MATQQPIFRILLVYHKRPVVRLYETLALTLFTTAFFLLFAIKPTAVTISNLLRDLESRRQLAQALDKKISAVLSAQSAFSGISPKLSILDETLPPTPSLTAFANQAEELAKLRQVSLRSLTFEEYNLFGGPVSQQAVTKGAANPVTVTPYPFALSVAGSYSNLYGFLGDLEALRRIVTITGFGFSQSQSETGVSLTLSVSGVVFAAQPSKLPTP